MVTFIVMDYVGDSRTSFTAAELAEAEFTRLRDAGYTPAKRTGTGTSALLREFDATAKEVLFFPRLVGG